MKWYNIIKAVVKVRYACPLNIGKVIDCYALIVKAVKLVIEFRQVFNGKGLTGGIHLMGLTFKLGKEGLPV
jgi:hypothetical protein